MLVIRIWEGLGNQMFQYAFARAYQIKTKREVYLDIENTYRFKNDKVNYRTEREYRLNNFRITLPLIPGELLRGWEYLKNSEWYHPMLERLSKKRWYPYKVLSEEGKKDISLYHNKYMELPGNIYAMGWFQSEEYFKDIRSILIREFSPKKKIRIPRGLRKVLEGTAVSVHIRRGDFLQQGLQLDREYYDKAIKYISENVIVPVFVIFSDEIEWVKNNFVFNDNVFYVENKYGFQDYEELLIMSKCNHNIIANSTFSWWGAWLNQNPDKIVIAPHDECWFSTHRNIVPDNWIQM